MVAKKKDFFISYAGKDEEWAMWIDTTLKKAGYTTIIQAVDFLPGMNFIEEMDKALKNSKQLIAVWSEAFFKSAYCRKEWTAAFCKYATTKRAIIPVRISGVKPDGLLAPIIYIDLHAVEESKREKILLGKIRIPKGIGDNSINQNIPGNKKIGDMPFHNLPHSRNPYFTGRKDKLKLVRSNFQSGDIVSLVQSMSGLGGVGKSSVALEYAYQNFDLYDTIWWINAESLETTLSAFMKFALVKGIITEDANSDEIIEEMKNWFGNNEKWLFIYDNADSNDFNKWLEPFFPQTRNGHVLITTRSNFFPKSVSIDIIVFNEAEAVSFLEKRTQKSGDGYTSALAKILSERLQYLPLALEQAAAYVIETPGVTYQDYLNLMEKYGIDIFQKKTTWSIMLQRSQ